MCVLWLFPDRRLALCSLAGRGGCLCVCCGSSLLDTTFTLFTQKYDNPSLMLCKTEESHWKQLRVEYMSEESGDESDSQVVMVHQPEWRSQRK